VAVVEEEGVVDWASTGSLNLVFHRCSDWSLRLADPENKHINNDVIMNEI